MAWGLVPALANPRSCSGSSRDTPGEQCEATEGLARQALGESRAQAPPDQKPLPPAALRDEETSYAEKNLEAAPGFEPGMTVLQTVALPLGYAASRPLFVARGMPHLPLGSAAAGKGSVFIAATRMVDKWMAMQLLRAA